MGDDDHIPGLRWDQVAGTGYAANGMERYARIDGREPCATNRDF